MKNGLKKELKSQSLLKKELKSQIRFSSYRLIRSGYVEKPSKLDTFWEKSVNFFDGNGFQNEQEEKDRKSNKYNHFNCTLYLESLGNEIYLYSSYHGSGTKVILNSSFRYEIVQTNLEEAKYNIIFNDGIKHFHVRVLDVMGVKSIEIWINKHIKKSNQDHKSRLIKLKNLLDEGLIDEEAYKKRRDDILKEI